MGGIRAPLTPEIDLGMAAVALVAGHRIGLGCYRQGGWIGGGDPESGRIAGFVIRRGLARPRLGRSSSRVSHQAATGSRPMANAFTSVPSTEKWSSDSSGGAWRCARIAAMILRDMSVLSSRSRFLRRRSAFGASPVQG